MFEPSEASRARYDEEHDAVSANPRVVCGPPHVPHMAEDAATRRRTVNAPAEIFSTAFAAPASARHDGPGWGVPVAEAEVLWTADSAGDEEEGIHDSSAADEDMSSPTSCTSLSAADLAECSGSLGDLSALHSNDDGCMAAPSESPPSSSRRHHSLETSLTLQTDSTKPQCSFVPSQGGVLSRVCTCSLPRVTAGSDKNDAGGAYRSPAIDETVHDGDCFESGKQCTPTLQLTRGTEHSSEAVTQLHPSVAARDPLSSATTTCIVTPHGQTARNTGGEWDSTSTKAPLAAAANSCSRAAAACCKETGVDGPPRHLTFTENTICIDISNNTSPNSFAHEPAQTAAHGDTSCQQLYSSRPGAIACPGMPTDWTASVPIHVSRQQCASGGSSSRPSQHGSDTCDLVFDDDDDAEMQQPPWSGTRGSPEVELSATDASHLQDGPARQNVTPGQGPHSRLEVEPILNVGSRTAGAMQSSRI